MYINDKLPWLYNGEYKDLNSYKSILKNIVPLSKVEERNLFNKYKLGCKKSEDLLILSQLKLVVKISVLLLKNKNSSLFDMIQEGNLALFEAIKNFDPSKGRFSTIASFYIKNKLLRKVMQDSSLVRIPESDGKRKAFNKLRQVKRNLKILDEITEKDISDIKKILNISRSDIFLADQRLKGDFYLNQKISNCDENTEWIDNLENPCNDNFISNEDEIISYLDNKKHKLNIIDYFNLFKNTNLNKIEKQVALYRFNSSKNYSLKETGKLIGKSAERVRQIELLIKEKFKKNFKII